MSFVPRRRLSGLRQNPKRKRIQQSSNRAVIDPSVKKGTNDVFSVNEAFSERTAEQTLFVKEIASSNAENAEAQPKSKPKSFEAEDVNTSSAYGKAPVTTEFSKPEPWEVELMERNDRLRQRSPQNNHRSATRKTKFGPGVSLTTDDLPNSTSNSKEKLLVQLEIAAGEIARAFNAKQFPQTMPTENWDGMISVGFKEFFTFGDRRHQGKAANEIAFECANQKGGAVAALFFLLMNNDINEQNIGFSEGLVKGIDAGQFFTPLFLDMQKSVPVFDEDEDKRKRYWAPRKKWYFNIATLPTIFGEDNIEEKSQRWANFEVPARQTNPLTAYAITDDVVSQLPLPSVSQKHSRFNGIRFGYSPYNGFDTCLDTDLGSISHVESFLNADVQFRKDLLIQFLVALIIFKTGFIEKILSQHDYDKTLKARILLLMHHRMATLEKVLCNEQNKTHKELLDLVSQEELNQALRDQIKDYNQSNSNRCFQLNENDCQEQAQGLISQLKLSETKTETQAKYLAKSINALLKYLGIKKAVHFENIFAEVLQFHQILQQMATFDRRFFTNNCEYHYLVNSIADLITKNINSNALNKLQIEIDVYKQRYDLAKSALDKAHKVFLEYVPQFPATCEESLGAIRHAFLDQFVRIINASSQWYNSISFNKYINRLNQLDAFLQKLLRIIKNDKKFKLAEIKNIAKLYFELSNPDDEDLILLKIKIKPYLSKDVFNLSCELLEDIKKHHGYLFRDVIAFESPSYLGSLLTCISVCNHPNTKISLLRFGLKNYQPKNLPNAKENNTNLLSALMCLVNTGLQERLVESGLVTQFLAHQDRLFNLPSAVIKNICSDFLKYHDQSTKNNAVLFQMLLLFYEKRLDRYLSEEKLAICAEFFKDEKRNLVSEQRQQFLTAVIESVDANLDSSWMKPILSCALHWHSQAPDNVANDSQAADFCSKMEKFTTSISRKLNSSNRYNQFSDDKKNRVARAALFNLTYEHELTTVKEQVANPKIFMKDLRTLNHKTIRFTYENHDDAAEQALTCSEKAIKAFSKNAEQPVKERLLDKNEYPELIKHRGLGKLIGNVVAVVAAWVLHGGFFAFIKPNWRAGFFGNRTLCAYASNSEKLLDRISSPTMRSR